MFNGKDMSGWSGATKFWKVKDGAIVGERKRTSKQTIFLYWKGGEPADFEMLCRLRISGKEANIPLQASVANNRPAAKAIEVIKQQTYGTKKDIIYQAIGAEVNLTT